MKTNLVKKISIICVSILIGSQLFAQDTFEIKVKLLKSANPEMKHATAVLRDSKTNEIVAENGKSNNNEFVFSEVKKGEYILEVQKPGDTKADTRYIIIDEKISIMNNTANQITDSPAKTKETLPAKYNSQSLASY